MSFADGINGKVRPDFVSGRMQDADVTGYFKGDNFKAFCGHYTKVIDENWNDATITPIDAKPYARRFAFLINSSASHFAQQEIIWRIIHGGLKVEGKTLPFGSEAQAFWNSNFMNGTIEKADIEFSPVNHINYTHLVFYADTGSKQPVIIVTPRNVNKTLVIKKTVSGVSGVSRTFDFDIYGNDNATNLLTTTKISVTGSNTSSVSYSFSVPFVTFLNGASFSLFVKEISNAPNANWNYDKALKIATFGYGTNSVTVPFENKYNGKGLIIVNKEWKGAGPYPESISFDLYRTRPILFGTETQKVGQPYTLSAANEWTTAIGDLDKEKNLTTWSYYVVEKPFEGSEKYTTSYSGNVQVNTNDEARTIKITNDNGLIKGKITVNKAWVGDNPDQPSSIVVDYTGPNNATGTLTLSSPDYTASIEPVFHKDSSVAYTFTERLPQDYILDTTVSGNTMSRHITMNKNGLTQSVTYTNKYVEPFGELTLTKNWENEGSDKGFRPAAVSFQLQKQNGEGVFEDYLAPVVISGNKAVNTWSDKVENLPFGTYQVVETAIDDYNNGLALTSAAVTLTKFDDDTKTSINGRKNGLAINNHFDNPTGSIIVEKVWNDKTIDRPTAIDVTLTGVKGSETVYSETQTLNSPASGNMVQVIFNELPLDGTVYTAEESLTHASEALKFANYDTAVTNNGVLIDSVNRNKKITITNTLNSGSVVVTKVWDHGLDTDPVQAVYFNLYKVVTLDVQKYAWVEVGPDEEQDDTAVIEEREGIYYRRVDEGTEKVKQDPEFVKTIQLSSGNTTAIFDDLQLKDEAHDVYYYVEESKVPFYTTYYPTSENAENTEVLNITLSDEHPNGSLTVKNVYEAPAVELTVTKTFEDGYNPNKPTSLTVYLIEDGVKVDEEGVTLTFTEGDRTESYTFTGLKLGHLYAIQEEGVDHYTSVGGPVPVYIPVKNYVTEAVAPGIVNLTNRYTPETKDLNVEKHWQGTTGAAVTVTLERAYFDAETESYKVDTAFSSIAPTVELTDDNAWKDVFKGLEIHGPNGQPYQYSVSESSVDLYLYDRLDQDTATLFGEGSKDTLVVTNKYSPNKAKLIIEKKWFHQDETPLTSEDLTGIERVEVRLYVDGVAEEATRFITKNQAGNWELVLENIDATKHYAVQEVTDFEDFDEGNREVPGKESYVGFNVEEMTQTITIDNYKNPAAPSISVVKEVIGKDSLPLINGNATFAYKLTVTNTGNRTLTNILVDDTVMVGSADATGITIGDVVGATYTKNVDNGGKFTLLSSESGSVYTLAPGDTAVVTYTVTVTASGTYDNIAHAEGTYNKIIHNSRNVTETVVSKPIGLVVEKTVSPSTINGTTGNFTFTVVVTNNGEYDLENVVLVDDMAGLETSRTFEIGNLPAQSGNSETGSHIRTFTYTLTTTSNGTHINTATVTGGFDGVTLRDTDPATFTLNRPVVNDEDDDDEPRVTPTPPVVIQDTTVPEALPTTEAPQEVPAAIVPLAVVTLPKTGEIPATVFFGLGGLLGGIGVFMRRKK